MMGCLFCVALIPTVRTSSLAGFFATIFIVGISVNVLYLQFRKHQKFSFLARPGTGRRFFRLLLLVPLVSFVWTVCDDAFERRLPILLDAIHFTEKTDVAKRDLGVPLVVGWPIKGSFDENQESAHRTLLIPVSGSHGQGSLRVVGTKANGVWKLTELTLILRDTNVRESIETGGPQ
jgi:hypothetical protein